MTDDPVRPSGKAERDRRLAEALRANLKRRKAQAKSRRAGDADGRSGLMSASDGQDGDEGRAGEGMDGDALVPPESAAPSKGTERS
ncbi:hypothetical protein [Chthonobacter rhizosphaerae]|uniref:hypothetical protein n=1 Tax=Chthonobacter rhizosphaerae TaxID=2735553 RepID=UPI0015EEFB3E|nr:hypothetical protein [Chthonobacter rhizosphaerae]